MKFYIALVAIGLALVQGGPVSAATDNFTTGPATCTYLGNYTISNVKCGSVLYFSDSCEDTMVSSGEQSDAAKKFWALSATATVGDKPIPYPVYSVGNRANCAPYRNLTIISDGQAALSGSPEESFRIVPKNASSDCNTVYLQAVGGSRDGQYLSYAGCNSTNGFNATETPTANGLWKVTPSGAPDYPMVENHAQDDKVTKSYMANGVLFQCTPANTSIAPKVVTFDRGIVYIGTDEANDVISFICPQKPTILPDSKGTLMLEVNINQVGGKINPISGAAEFFLDDVSWMLWTDGNVSLAGMPSFSMTKDQAAQISLVNANGERKLYLKNIAKNSSADAFAIGVEAYTGAPYPNQNEQQIALAKLVNQLTPGLLNKDTKLQWNIYPEAYTVPNGSEYLDWANHQEMDEEQANAPAASASQLLRPSGPVGCVLFLVSLFYSMVSIW